MFTRLKLWISLIVALLLQKRVPASHKAEKLPHKLNLQFFASEDGDDDEGGDDDDQDDQDGDDEDDEDQDEEQTLEQMIKDDPNLKKQFNQLFKSKFDKRLKGVDLKKAKELLAIEQQKQDDKQGEGSDEDDAKTANLQLKLDRKAKRLSVKEYAADHGQNPKLVARLIDLDKLELNEDGEVDPDDLEDAFDTLEDEFPDLFAADDGDEDEDEEEQPRRKKKRSAYRPGSRQRGNKKPKHDPYESGKARALARHKKEE
ncbi:hypothetical protein [Sporolactobacillus terrae]|uniref:hypothetical protein n=1 Tax=Sporolactobacillus terrae TaxID=269673 RepID=UPI001CBB6ED8|nr:hypothetical protein [Sporolactobacillus terrae]UAK17563.1 hypothetical protein K7399_06450 [Sporolactobacillus terrae]